MIHFLHDATLSLVELKYFIIYVHFGSEFASIK